MNLRIVAALVVLLVGCRDRTEGVVLPVASATGVPVTPLPSASAASPAHALTKKERAFTATKLPSTDLPADVFLRGTLDPAFRASVDAAVRSLRRSTPTPGPEGRFLVGGVDAQQIAQVILFDAAGKAIGTQQGEHPFFAADGSVVFHRGPKVFVWDGAAPPHAAYGDQSALCVTASCKAKTIPIALSADRRIALVGIFRGGFVSDDESFALDLATGATTPVVARSKDVAYLSGTTLADGTYCSFRTAVRQGDGPSTPGVLLCYAPPWASGRALIETDGGAWVALGGVAGKVVTGDVHTLHVLDPKTAEHRAYPSPEGGGLIMPLRDGRSVAIEGDHAIVLVDVVDETYAVYPTERTIVMALGDGVKGFISTGDGTATLVRYE